MLPAELADKQAEIVLYSCIYRVLYSFFILACRAVHMYRKHRVGVLVGLQYFVSVFENAVCTLSPACTVDYQCILYSCVTQFLYGIDISVTPRFKIVICSVPLVSYIDDSVSLVLAKQILHFYPVIHCVFKIGNFVLSCTVMYFKYGYKVFLLALSDKALKLGS